MLKRAGERIRYIADLHIHSRYAGACSEALNLVNIDRTAVEKGIDLVGTGDFTHPDWLSEIKEGLEGENGVYRLRGRGSEKKSTGFVLSTEVCTIFNAGNGVKKIHHCILAPDLAAAESINDQVKRFGDLKADGRPMLSVAASELSEILHNIDKNIILYPAHAWTPWYGVFGSYGFSSLKEAYEDQAMHIHAIETGLSSDPALNWRVSALDKHALLSGSDAHSLPKLGREAVVLEMADQPSYKELARCITEKRLKMTVEFYPEEGKYHYDGHRKCGVSLSPEQAKKYNGICPVCRKKLTMGVLHRIEELADREEGARPNGAVPYVSAVPLQEILAYLSHKAATSETVKKAYETLVAAFGSEFHVLLDATVDEIRRIDKELALAVENVREGRISITPGYDGVFGVVDILNRDRKKKHGMQSSMTDF